MVTWLKLWEAVNTANGRRVSLHWTRRSAESAAYLCDGMEPRLRALPRWTRPLHRLIRW